FFSSRRRHTRFSRDWSSDVCSSDLDEGAGDRQHLLLAAGQVGAAAATPLGEARENLVNAVERPASGRGERGEVEILLDAEAAERSEERRVGKESREWQVLKY